MHLPDRSCRERPRLKSLQLFLEVGSQPICQNLLQLGVGHGVACVAQGRKDVGQFLGQQVSRIHGEDLSQFHRGATHLRKLRRESHRIFGRQQKVPHPGALTGSQLRGAAREHIACHAAGEACEFTKALYTALRHRALLTARCHAACFVHLLIHRY